MAKNSKLKLLAMVTGYARTIANQLTDHSATGYARARIQYKGLCHGFVIACRMQGMSGCIK